MSMDHGPYQISQVGERIWRSWTSSATVEDPSASEQHPTEGRNGQKPCGGGNPPLRLGGVVGGFSEVERFTPPKEAQKLVCRAKFACLEL